MKEVRRRRRKGGGVRPADKKTIMCSNIVVAREWSNNVIMIFKVAKLQTRCGE